MVTRLILGLAIGGVSHAAMADVPKLNGELACKTAVDGRDRVLNARTKPGKLVEPILCTLRLDDQTEHEVGVRLVHHRAGSGSGGGIKKIAPLTISGGSLEFALAPDDKSVAGNPLWTPCEDFDVVARIKDTTFERSIGVRQGCPAPRPVKAKLQCTYDDGEGKVVTFPGPTPAPRMEGDLTCGITLPDGASYQGWSASFAVVHAGETVDPNVATSHDFLAVRMPDGDATTQFEADEYRTCTPFTVIATAYDADSNERYRGKLAIQQRCHK